jgi:hypothetical protein
MLASLAKLRHRDCDFCDYSMRCVNRRNASIQQTHRAKLFQIVQLNVVFFARVHLAHPTNHLHHLFLFLLFLALFVLCQLQRCQGHAVYNRFGAAALPARQDCPKLTSHLDAFEQCANARRRGSRTTFYMYPWDTTTVDPIHRLSFFHVFDFQLLLSSVQFFFFFFSIFCRLKAFESTTCTIAWPDSIISTNEFNDCTRFIVLFFIS